MAAAVWTACTKKLPFCRKKVWPRGDPGPCCFTGIFEGVLEKVGGFGVVFCGDFVVDRW
jgi:hypothetical protein